MKALVGAFNQEKALVGAFSVIVHLHRLIDLRHYKTSHNKCDNVAVNVNVNVISGDMDLLFTPHCSKYTSQQPTGSVSGRHHSFSFCHIRIRLNSIIFQSLKCHNEPRLEQKMQKPAFLRLGGGAGPWHLETAFSAARAICAKINKYCTTWQQ